MSEIASVRKRLEQALALVHAQLEEPDRGSLDDARQLVEQAIAGLRRRPARATLEDSHALVQLVAQLHAALAVLEASGKEKAARSARLSVSPEGVEPSTNGLRVRCSAS